MNRTSAAYSRRLPWPECRPRRFARFSSEPFPGAAELAVEDRTGTGDHFQVTVVSADFDGLSLLDQHRRVNDAAAPLAARRRLRSTSSAIKTKGTT